MYSVILMAAMAGSPDTASFGWRSAGCSGCSGSYSAGCTGSSCYGSSCYGSSCYGSCHGGLFPRLRNLFSCHGSSCSGSSCSGSSCSGSCYGQGAGTGCWGSCYGRGAGTGCWGSCYGTGCVGAGCAGGGYMVGSTGPAASEAFGSTQTVTAARITESAKAPARLTVELPATARLFVDGTAVSGTGSSRLFHTPELPGGQAFFYDMKAEVVVNGTPVIEETRAIVRAGESITVVFPKLLAASGTTSTVAAAR